jgi:hypothetical protein
MLALIRQEAVARHRIDSMADLLAMVQLRTHVRVYDSIRRMFSKYSNGKLEVEGLKGALEEMSGGREVSDSLAASIISETANNQDVLNFEEFASVVLNQSTKGLSVILEWYNGLEATGGNQLEFGSNQPGVDRWLKTSSQGTSFQPLFRITHSLQ